MALTRAQYDLQRRNQANLKRVTDLLANEATRVLGTGRNITGQQDMGGFLRTVVPGLIDRYGNVNAAVAVEYYDAQRLAFMEKHSAYPGAPRSVRTNARRRAERVATARTQGQLYVAKLPKFDAIAKADTVVNYGMALFQGAGYDALTSEVTNAMTRAVASYNRDTMLFNSALDDAVVGVQRVAEPNACDFCQTVAFDSYGGVRVSDYAVEWHNNCHCSLETIYVGDSKYRPDYYDDFEYGNTTADAPDSTYRTEGWSDFKASVTQDYVSA